MGKAKHNLNVRLRAFRIWQNLGTLPWTKTVGKSSSKRRFSKGAFDSIPFLNADAKRTFVHLLLRPGYMIRDYIRGDNERFLAPLTSLIVFYAFFAMLVSIMKPDFSAMKEQTPEASVQFDAVEDAAGHTERVKRTVAILRFIDNNKYIFSLDKHPEVVDSPAKASLAALEGSLRSQGIYLFLGNFLMLWLAMWLSLRWRGLSLSASAAAAAYILCQFCFFMFFVLIISLGQKMKIGFWVTAALIVWDYSQLFGVNWKKSLRLTVGTGLAYVFIYAVIFAVLILALLLATRIGT